MRNYLKSIRDRDLRNIYDNLVKCKGLNVKIMKRSLIINTFMEMPAPRFYITEKMVERYVCAYLKGRYITKNRLKIKINFRQTYIQILVYLILIFLIQQTTQLRLRITTDIKAAGQLLNILTKIRNLNLTESHYSSG